MRTSFSTARDSTRGGFKRPARHHGGMGVLHVTTEQLEREFLKIFKDGRDVPTKCWIEHYHDYHSFLRAIYAGEFTARAADRLMKLRAALQGLYGKRSSVTIVIMLDDHDWDWLAAHRLLIHTK